MAAGWPVQTDKIDWAAGPLGWFRNSHAVGLATSEEDKVAKRFLQGIRSLCS